MGMSRSEDVLEEMMCLRRAGEDAVLATVVDTNEGSPGRTGFKMLVYPDGHILGTVGGGMLEAKVIEHARLILENRRPGLLRLKLTEVESQGIGVLCGGEAEVYLEPIGAPPFLYLFGAGHIGLALAQKAADLDFRLVVLDDREAFANRDRFPQAWDIRAEPWERILAEIQFLPKDAVVIVTRGHEADELVLGVVLRRNSFPFYIGMIGSRAKVATIFEHLHQDGIAEDRIAQVHSPIGLDIGGEQPSEIAISILAEIIAHRHGKLARVASLSSRQDEASPPK
jgi:xanthine dehydrogenase accessory factor